MDWYLYTKNYKQPFWCIMEMNRDNLQINDNFETTELKKLKILSVDFF